MGGNGGGRGAVMIPTWNGVTKAKQDLPVPVRQRSPYNIYPSLGHLSLHSFPLRLLRTYQSTTMASVLQPPPHHSHSPRSPIGGGILLNPSPYRLPSPLPPSSY